MKTAVFYIKIGIKLISSSSFFKAFFGSFCPFLQNIFKNPLAKIVIL